METNQPLDRDLHADLHLSGRNRDDLDQTASWAKFLAIVGFVFVGFMVIAALSMAFFANAMPAEMETLPGGMSLIIFFYLLIGAVYFVPILYLYRFASNMKDALRVNDQGYLDTAIANIKSHYRFIGILMIAILALYGLGIVGFLIVGAGMAF